MGVEAILAKVGKTGVEFLLLTAKVLPYFLIGVAAGALIQIPRAQKWFVRFLGGRGFRPLLSAVVAAAVLPGCSCATIPMAAGIKGAGSPRRGVVAAFIFMSPLLGPITVALTWAMLGWRMTAARVVASFAGSILFGLLLDWFEPFMAGSANKAGANPEACGCGSAGCEAPPSAGSGSGSLVVVSKAFVSILKGVLPGFLLGMLIAAGLSVALPEGAIPRFLGSSSGVVAYLLAALVGIPLYVCEGEEVPITFALLSRGLGLGPAFTFLLGSVGTCVPTILMSRSIIGNRATVFYAVFWLIFSLAAGVIFSLMVVGHP